LKLGSGVALISIVDGEEMLFSEHFACVHCEISIGEIAPRTLASIVRTALARPVPD